MSHRTGIRIVIGGAACLVALGVGVSLPVPSDGDITTLPNVTHRTAFPACPTHDGLADAPLPCTYVGDDGVTYLVDADHNDYAPCVEEDDTTPCYWNAALRDGNGLGTSFYVTVDGAVHYAGGVAP